MGRLCGSSWLTGIGARAEKTVVSTNAKMWDRLTREDQIMADTDTIKTTGADGKALATTRLTLTKNLEHWIWCNEKGFNISQALQPLTDDLRLALAAVRSGTGNAQ